MKGEQGQAIHRMIGERVRAARKMLGLTQRDVSNELGFKDRQTLSNIEAGIRKVSADELLSFVRILKQSIEFFTDPYLIAEEQVFSWRADRESNLIREYEDKARKAVSAFRRFSELLNETFDPLTHKLAFLTKRSSFEEAADAGERVVEKLELGEIPADDLHNTITEKLAIPVLFVDAPEMISGAACSLPEFSAILINRNEPAWRRNFDLAHELFHVLTWDNMPPNPIDPRREFETGGPREEKLANSFAAGLLMPSVSLSDRWSKRGSAEINEYVMSLSEEYGVSGQAMFYRLKNLGWLTEKDRLEIDEDRLRRSMVDATNGPQPKLYSEGFAKRVFGVLDKGLVSQRRVAELLDCTIDDVADLLHAYGMEMPF